MLFIFPRSLNKSLLLNENFAFLLKSIQFGLFLIHSAYTGKILLFTEKLNLMCISNLLEFLRNPIKQLKKGFMDFLCIYLIRVDFLHRLNLWIYCELFLFLVVMPLFWLLCRLNFELICRRPYLNRISYSFTYLYSRFKSLLVYPFCRRKY